jgi:guanine deaminase
VKAQGGPDVEIVDHRPHLILPGFIDCHAALPQMQVIASYGAELLDWLNTYTFPEETKFATPSMAAHRAAVPRRTGPPRHDDGRRLLLGAQGVGRSLLRRGHARNMLNIAGKVMMDRNAPDGVLDTPQSAMTTRRR